jgi:bla regulator protein BlaR1
MMESVITFVQSFFDWLLETTLIASVVICLILAAQKMLGGKLGPRWCHALWLVLLLRMVLPWAPSSRLSLSNLIPSWDRHVQSQQLPRIVEQRDVSAAAETALNSEMSPDPEPQVEVVGQKAVAPQPQTLADVEGKSGPQLVSISRLLPIVWLAGAVVVGAYVILSDLALWRIVKRDRPLVNQETLELFEGCKAQMGIQSLVVVVPSGHVRSPGLFSALSGRVYCSRERCSTAPPMRRCDTSFCTSWLT